MECEVDENQCTKCVTFKTPLDVRILVKKIAEILGLDEFEEVDDGTFVLKDGTVVRCREVRFDNWTDYCMQCYADF